MLPAGAEMDSVGGALFGSANAMPILQILVCGIRIDQPCFFQEITTTGFRAELQRVPQEILNIFIFLFG
ncbi:MAG TPA: hypothetical protein DEP61_01520 [Lachnospiraceae bacterium]|nr:hypothetical protein [Lachnospiraceae bacterium]